MARKANTEDELMVPAEELDAAVEEKMVEVYFPPVSRKDEMNFVQIGCNGEMIHVKKGERVMIPERFANVLRDAQAQAAVNAEKILKANS